MAKIILINGSCHEHGNTYIALKEVEKELNRYGVETEIIWIGQMPIQDCVACNKCADIGLCVFNNDQVNDVLEEIEDSDGIVVGSPVYYGGASGRLCSFLDRLFYAASWKRSFAGKIGAAVVVCRRGGATAAFDRLNNFFLMNNMIVPASQYWNQIHGAKPGEAAEDEEGLQTMRTLATNIAWVLSGIEGKPKPEYENRISTNFIR